VQLKFRPFLFLRQRLIATEVGEVAEHAEAEFGVTAKVDMRLLTPRWGGVGSQCLHKKERRKEGRLRMPCRISKNPKPSNCATALCHRIHTFTINYMLILHLIYIPHL
jgi:hypothetical protein